MYLVLLLEKCLVDSLDQPPHLRKKLKSLLVSALTNCRKLMGEEPSTPSQSTGLVVTKTLLDAMKKLTISVCFFSDSCSHNFFLSFPCPPVLSFVLVGTNCFRRRAQSLVLNGYKKRSALSLDFFTFSPSRSSGTRYQTISWTLLNFLSFLNKNSVQFLGFPWQQMRKSIFFVYFPQLLLATSNVHTYSNYVMLNVYL